MDIFMIVGILGALAGIIGGCIMQSHTDAWSALQGLWSPAALLIILSGTAGALLVSFPIHDLKLIGPLLRAAFQISKPDEVHTIRLLVRFSEIARKEGLLALESEISQTENQMIEKGLTLIFEGKDSRTTRRILSWDMQMQHDDEMRGAELFAAAGRYSIAMGIVGTVTGLLLALPGNLENMAELASGITAALAATLYGLGLAFLLWIPLKNRIKSRSARDHLINKLVIEGLLSIQDGDAPDVVRDKMNLAHFEKASAAEANATTKGAIEGME